MKQLDRRCLVSSGNNTVNALYSRILKACLDASQIGPTEYDLH